MADFTQVMNEAWRALHNTGHLQEFDLHLTNSQMVLQSRRALFVDGVIDHPTAVPGVVKKLMTQVQVQREAA